MSQSLIECANKKCTDFNIEKSPNKVDFNRSKNCVHCQCDQALKSIAQQDYVENGQWHKVWNTIAL